jgi:hypothetical protein
MITSVMIAARRRAPRPFNREKITNLPIFARTFLALLIPAAVLKLPPN